MHLSPESYPSARFLVHPLDGGEHVLLFLKSALVAGSWIFGYFPLIGLLLLSADLLYFTAIAQEGALIAVISPIRRAAVVLTFLGGILLHKELNFRPKLVCISFILVGIVLIKAGSG